MKNSHIVSTIRNRHVCQSWRAEQALPTKCSHCTLAQAFLFICLFKWMNIRRGEWGNTLGMHQQIAMVTSHCQGCLLLPPWCCYMQHSWTTATDPYKGAWHLSKPFWLLWPRIPEAVVCLPLEMLHSLQHSWTSALKLYIQGSWTSVPVASRKFALTNLHLIIEADLTNYISN